MGEGDESQERPITPNFSEQTLQECEQQQQPPQFESEEMGGEAAQNLPITPGHSPHTELIYQPIVENITPEQTPMSSLTQQALKELFMEVESGQQIEMDEVAKAVASLSGESVNITSQYIVQPENMEVEPYVPERVNKRKVFEEDDDPFVMETLCTFPRRTVPIAVKKIKMGDSPPKDESESESESEGEEGEDVEEAEEAQEGEEGEEGEEEDDPDYIEPLQYVVVEQQQQPEDEEEEEEDEVEIEPKTFKPRIEVKVKSAVCVVRANYESTLPKAPVLKSKIKIKKFKLMMKALKKEVEPAKVKFVEEINILDDDAFQYPLEWKSKVLRVSRLLESTSLRLIESKAGKFMTSMSQTDTLDHCLRRLDVVNYAVFDDGTYIFAKGIVPRKMKEFVDYIVQTYEKFNVAQPQQKNGKMYSPLHDGDIELLSYIYWQMSNTDLLNWKNATPRTALKKHLHYALSLTPKSTELKEVVKSINFNDKKFITANTILLIKKHYEKFMSSINERQKESVEKEEKKKPAPQKKKADSKKTQADKKADDDDEEEEEIEIERNKMVPKHIRSIWHHFMERAGIHHYYCPHTKVKLMKLAQDYVRVLKRLACHAAGEEHDVLQDIPISPQTTVAILGMYRGFPSSGKAIKRLSASVSHFFTAWSLIFARHIVRYGICSNGQILTRHHVDGFMTNHMKRCNQKFQFVVGLKVNTKICGEIAKVIYGEIKRVSEGTVDFKSDSMETLDLIYKYFHWMLVSALQTLCGLTDTEKMTEIAVSLLKEVFDDPEFLALNPDLWDDTYGSDWEDAGDENDDEEEEEGEKQTDENGQPIVKVAKPVVEEVEETDEEEYEVDDEDVYAEARALRQDLSDERFNQLLTNISSFEGVSKTRVSREPRKEKPKVKTQDLLTNSFYRVNKDNVSRVKCTMCFKAMTSKTVDIDVHRVACCMRCVGRLITDLNSESPSFNHEELVERIKRQCKQPIAFDLETDEWIERPSLQTSKFNYDRNLPEKVHKKKKESKTKDEETESSKSPEKTYKPKKIVNE